MFTLLNPHTPHDIHGSATIEYLKGLNVFACHGHVRRFTKEINDFGLVKPYKTADGSAWVLPKAEEHKNCGAPVA